MHDWRDLREGDRFVAAQILFAARPCCSSPPPAFVGVDDAMMARLETHLICGRRALINKSTQWSVAVVSVVLFFSWQYHGNPVLGTRQRVERRDSPFLSMYMYSVLFLL